MFALFNPTCNNPLVHIKLIKHIVLIEENNHMQIETYVNSYLTREHRSADANGTLDRHMCRVIDDYVNDY